MLSPSLSLSLSLSLQLSSFKKKRKKTSKYSSHNQRKSRLKYASTWPLLQPIIVDDLAYYKLKQILHLRTDQWDNAFWSRFQWNRKRERKRREKIRNNRFTELSPVSNFRAHSSRRIPPGYSFDAPFLFTLQPSYPSPLRRRSFISPQSLARSRERGEKGSAWRRLNGTPLW